MPSAGSCSRWRPAGLERSAESAANPTTPDIRCPAAAVVPCGPLAPGAVPGSLRCAAVLASSGAGGPVDALCRPRTGSWFAVVGCAGPRPAGSAVGPPPRPVGRVSSSRHRRSPFPIALARLPLPPPRFVAPFPRGPSRVPVRDGSVVSVRGALAFSTRAPYASSHTLKMSLMDGQVDGRPGSWKASTPHSSRQRRQPFGSRCFEHRRVELQWLCPLRERPNRARHLESATFRMRLRARGAGRAVLPGLNGHDAPPTKGHIMRSRFYGTALGPPARGRREGRSST